MNVKTLRSLFLMLVCVCMLAVMATPAMAWWVNQNNDPAAAGGPWSAATDCGWYRYVYSHFTSCAGRGAWVSYQPGFVWHGRGYIHMDYVMTPKGYTNDLLQYYNSDYGNPYNAWVNTCPYGCQWIQIVDGYTNDMYNWNGLYMNADNSTACGSPGICGSAITASRSINTYGDRFAYLNDWTILGYYSQSTLAETTGTNFLNGEANLYMFPYVDTGGGDTICAGLFNGKHPERYNPGDMNNVYSIDFAGKWGQLSGVSAYALAWVYSPAGAGPRFNIGSDDGERCWVNGGLITDTGTIGRGLTRDIDQTGGIGLGAGWSRVMLKVQSGGGGWGGTVSLRAGDDNRQCEGSVNFQASAGGGVDRYGGYSVGYEQDSWYPTLTLSNADGVSSPGLGAVIYTNNTTVTASGTCSANFIPFWKTMQTQWGYGISGSTYYLATNVTSGTTWSHSEAGVTGHRRLHFFGVSASGRTSGQASGQGSGWTWDNSGHGNYFDVYVDNVAPVDPSLSSVTVVSPNRVDLAWGIPLDRGCGGVSNGSAEVATAINGGTNYYLRGDVGVNVRHNGSSIYGWGTGTSFSDTSLTSNTQYAYDIAARDNTGSGRGAWQNTGSYVGTTSVYTLAEAPLGGTNITAPAAGAYMAAAWPGVTSSSFGTGNHLITKFMYKWSTSGSDSIAEGAGTNWSSGTMTNLPGSAGTYYLYVRSYNGATVGNGSTKFGPYEITYDAIAPTVTNVTVTPQNVGAGGDCLKGDLWVYADVEDNPGGTGIDTVEVMLTGGSWTPMTLKSGTTKTYEKQFTIDTSSVNGARTAYVRAKDLAGNITDPVVTKGYTVNKNEVSGEIALQGFRNNSTSRDVAFVLNGTIAKPVTLAFVGGKVGYSFTDVPEITSISAKTAWTLRKKLGVTPVNGQSDVDFTGSYPLLGGDLNGDNVVNALDYSALRSAWGEFSVGDISGDGWTNNADYLVLKSNWYKKGEAQ